MATNSDFFIPASSVEAGDISGYRLILPTVSVGNVAQLTVDVIINSLQLELYGWINDDSIMPVVGNDAFDHLASLTTSAELYVGRKEKLLILQLRSPLAKGRSAKFVDKLLEWAEGNGLCQVIVLASLYSEERVDRHILSSPFRFVLNAKSSPLYDHFATHLHWIPMEPRKLDNTNSLPGVLNEEDLFLPGSGFARYIYKKSGLPLVLITVFSAQGNNVPDAINMATHLNEWIQLSEAKDWVLPKSWNSVFGGPHPESLY